MASLTEKAQLHAMRSSRDQAEVVAQLGTALLRSHSSRLGEEVWATYEQVYVALLEHGKHPSPAGNAALELAQEYANALSERFPASLRVKRLEGLMWEAKGEYELAMKDYDSIVTDDPNNVPALKRQATPFQPPLRPLLLPLFCHATSRLSARSPESADAWRVRAGTCTQLAHPWVDGVGWPRARAGARRGSGRVGGESRRMHVRLGGWVSLILSLRRSRYCARRGVRQRHRGGCASTSRSCAPMRTRGLSCMRCTSRASKRDGRPFAWRS